MQIDITKELDTLKELFHAGKLTWDVYMEKVERQLARKSYWEGEGSLAPDGRIRNILLLKHTRRF